MLKLTRGKARSRLAAFGMVALLFVAGLAFSVFENTAVPRLMPSIGLAEEGETVVVSSDPRLDPDDCLYDPAAVKELTAGPHGNESAGDADPGVPVNHPGTGTSSPVVEGDGGGTGSTGSPEGSTDSPDSPSGGSGSDDSPSSGDSDGAGDARPVAPHDGILETECPGLE